MEKDSSEDAYALMYAGQKIEQLTNELVAQQKKVAIAVALIRYSVRLHAEKTESPTFWRDFWANALTHIEQPEGEFLLEVTHYGVFRVIGAASPEAIRLGAVLALLSDSPYEAKLRKRAETAEELVRRAVALVSSSDPMTRADVDFVEDAQKALGEL